MSKVRAAFVDSAHSPRYVEMIPRHGYRFLAPVYQPHSEHEHAAGHELEDDLFAGNGKSGAHAENHHGFPIADLQTPSGKRRLYILVAAIAFTAVVLVAIRVLQPATSSGSRGVVSPRRSVAVLGFTNLSGDPHEAWLSTAFSDSLSTELSAGGQLRTLPAENIARMKAELSLNDMESLGRGNLEQIHKDLGTDLVVAGSYASLGANPPRRIRLDLRLFDTQSGETLYADSETGTQEGLFDLVSRAGEKLRINLGVRKITKEEAVEVATALPSNAEAAHLYAEGLSKLSVFDALSARDSLLKAVATEPNYALSHAALATAWAQLGDDQNAAEEAKKAFNPSSNLSRADRLLDEADQAVRGARERYLAAHDQRGVADAETGEAIALMFRGDYFSARQRYQEALAIHKNIGNMHSVAGEFHNLGEISLFLGDVRGALQKHQEALRTYEDVRDDNGVALAKIGLGAALFTEGKLFDARKMYEESLNTCRQNGDRDREAEALLGLGQVSRAQGDSRAAWESEIHA